MQKERWTGPTYFRKKLKEAVKKTEPGQDNDGSMPARSSPSSRGDCSPSSGAIGSENAASHGSPIYGGTQTEDATGIARSGGLASTLKSDCPTEDEFCGRIAQLKTKTKMMIPSLCQITLFRWLRKMLIGISGKNEALTRRRAYAKQKSTNASRKREN